MPSKRVYTDKEISAVLKRAAELQRTQGPKATSGLSLDELEQVAAEVGIDPDFVKAAALELEEGRTAQTYQMLGAPTTLELERIVEGEMTDAKWEEAVGEIRRVFGTAGETGQLGRTREWILRDQTGERIHLTMSPQNGKTEIRFVFRMTDWAIALHAPLTSIAIVPIILQFIFLQFNPLIEIGIAFFILFALHMLARFAFGAIARKQERKARKLLARLQNLLETPEAPQPARVALPTAPEADRIDASLLSDEAESEHPSSERTQEARPRRRTR